MAVALPYVLAAVAAVGSYTQSKQAENAAEYQSKVANVNAQNILTQASANEDTQRRRSAQQLGQQRAAIAESGLDLTSGTGADLTSSSALNAEMDALNIRYEGTINASNARAQSNIYKMQSKNISSASGMNAATSALSAYSGSGGSFKGSKGLTNG